MNTPNPFRVFRQFAAARPAGTRLAPQPAQAIHQERDINTTLSPAFPEVGVAEPDAMASGSVTASTNDMNPWSEARESLTSSDPRYDDSAERVLSSLGIGRPPKSSVDPRLLVATAHTMTNPELGELIVQLSAENDRVSRLVVDQEYIAKQIVHRRRDREAELRCEVSGRNQRLEDVTWTDPICRKLNELLLMQEHVRDALRADRDALERHHAAVSRLIEVRRQEQQRDLIDINVPNRRSGR